ncbi:DUF2971 domain-containing protein [Flammeovirga sp. SubArs3]|uniref:DUF2971 domain-containing protein n=1 Tax=Flammeovirga sp. SubArs3 TaxID=2995316 RepID=UPI00248BECA6|nr:DUF2971 domain-containing protein [Flammeovirga sp. SubArs3]
MNEQELVYKYSDWNSYSKEAINKRYFWFSKPTNFNDPFDSNMGILMASPRTKAVFEKQDENGRTFFEFIKENTDEFGILCFTSPRAEGEMGDKGYNNLHFWSHYANCHKGISIGYDLAKLKDYYSEKLQCNASLSEINYIEKAADIDNYDFLVGENHTKRIEGIFGPYRDDKHIDAFFEQILLFKDERIWGLENEQRIILAGLALKQLKSSNPFHDIGFDIFADNGKGYRLPYPEGNVIKEVTFGVKFDKSEIESAVKTILKTNKSVKFYKAKLDFVNANITREFIE